MVDLQKERIQMHQFNCTVEFLFKYHHDKSDRRTDRNYYYAFSFNGTEIPENVNQSAIGILAHNEFVKAQFPYSW